MLERARVLAKIFERSSQSKMQRDQALDVKRSRIAVKFKHRDKKRIVGGHAFSN